MFAQPGGRVPITHFNILPMYHQLDKPVKVSLRMTGLDYDATAHLLKWNPSNLHIFDDGLEQVLSWADVASIVIVPEDFPAFYRAEVAAQIFLVTTPTIRAWIKSGKLTGYKRNERWLVTTESVKALLKEKNG